MKATSNQQFSCPLFSRSKSLFSGVKIVIAHQTTLNALHNKSIAHKTNTMNSNIQKIKVIPLVEESFGVRSECTNMETSDIQILLDTSVSLAPKRNGYFQHPKEYQAQAQYRKKINNAAEKSDIITISHYQFDHHTPSYTDWFTNWSSVEAAKKIYKGKLVLAKSYRSKVNASQRRRGWMFTKTRGISLKRNHHALISKSR